MLKYSHILIIYCIAIALSFVGSSLKKEDFPYTSECLLVSMALQVFAFATLVFKIIKQKGLKKRNKYVGKSQ